MRLLTSDRPSGSVTRRRLLPAAIGLLVVLGFLCWRGGEWGFYQAGVGVAALTAAAIVLMGTLLLHFAHWLDRTEAARRQADDELRRSSRYFEMSRDLVCSAGFDGVFQLLNVAWTETLGWTDAELRSRPFVEFVHPDDRAGTELETAMLAGGGVTVDFINRYATKDGGWRWLEWVATAVVEDGVIYASARDVTQRKTAEAALEASERQTRQILDTAHDAFISIDARGVITDWNLQAQVTFGWSRQEALGLELAETIIPEGLRAEHRRGMERLLATGEARVLGRRLELTAVHRDGREFPVELTISPLETALGRSFNAFLRDITERNRAQEELALARDQALEASRMKSMFVANVSHEIRTPMNGVIGMTALLLDTGLDDEQHEYAETISSSGETLLAIIDDILDFSKIEAGKLELDPTNFDLREAIERACGMLAARAHEKGLELVVAIDPQVPAVVHGDAARLRQVIANLVSNAIKFTAAGEVVLRVSTGSATQGPGLLRVEVSDTGIGIEVTALEQLFTPYTQADGSTTRKYGGTGLGLAISLQLVKLMGGTFGADSQPGRGSTFWFELSLPRAESCDGAHDEERELAGLRVLVVDDNATSRRILARQLGSWQMSCDVADNATHAMKMLESAARAGIPYALALIDLNMPDVDGLELAGRIRGQPALRAVRLVLLTPAGVRAEGAGEVGLNGLLTKPVRESRLYEEIQRVIAGDRPALAVDRRPAVETAAGLRGDLPDVLVVEDTPVNQAVAAHMLEKFGFRPHLAENGRQALKALSERSFAAILMDCQMPELDGYETTMEIRRRQTGGRQIPIIAMTANSMQGERERCLAAGMDDYLTKPLRKQPLKDALTRWIPEPTPDLAGANMTSPTSATPSANGGPELLREAVIAELESIDSELLASLVALYFDDAAECMSELSGAIKRGEALSVGETAHKLKGSSGSVGAAQVSDIAAQLEVSARAGDLTGAVELLDRLRTGLDETKQAFRGRVPEPRAAS